MVQGLVTADSDGPERASDSYFGVVCISCGDTHLVNPRTGRVLGQSQPDG